MNCFVVFVELIFVVYVNTTHQNSLSCFDKCELEALDCTARNGHLRRGFLRCFKYERYCKNLCQVHHAKRSTTKCLGKCDTDFMLCEGAAGSMKESFKCLNHRHYCDGSCNGIRVTKM